MALWKILGWILLILLLGVMTATFCLTLHKYVRKDWERTVVSPINLQRANELAKKQYDKERKQKRMAIVTLEDRQDLDYVQTQRKIIQKYCQKYQTVQQINTPDLQSVYAICNTPQSIYTCEDYPTYWQKIPALWAVLGTNKYDYVMWLDSDAAMTNACGPLADIFDMTPEKHLFVVSEFFHRHTLNAGCFAIRNSPEGRQIMQALLDSYFKMEIKDRWSKTKDGKKWECDMCWFGGEEYEQGQLNRVAKTYKDWVIQYYGRQMNSNGTDDMFAIFSVRVDPLIEHYYGRPIEQRNTNMRKNLAGFDS
jgi:hypothetical protein